MARQRYYIKESLNRILRMFQGKEEPSESPNTLSGEILSHNQAFSDLAELLAGSLPNETAELPDSLTASVAQANAEADDTVALTPLSHTWIHEYGGIYIETGTAQPSLTADVWTKITGAFQYYTEDSGGEILCDWNDDQIVINEVGTFLVSYQMSLGTVDGAEARLQLQVFSSGTAMGMTRSEIVFDNSGSCLSMSAFAPVSILVTGTPVDIRGRPDSTIVIAPMAGQLLVQRMVG